MNADDAPVARAASDEERDAALNREPWGKLLAQLTAIALKRIRGRSLDDAQDLAQTAIERAYRSRAAGGWDPDKGPLMSFLVAQIVSDTLNERRRKRNRCEVWLDEEIEDGDINKHERHLGDGKPAPDEALGGLQLASTFRDRIEARVADDEEARSLVDPMSDGISKPIDLAKAIGRDVETVRAARRRLRYHAEQITKELSIAVPAPGARDGNEVTQ